MKGYLVLIAVVFGILLLLPAAFCMPVTDKQTAAQTAVTVQTTATTATNTVAPADDRFTVQYTDKSTESELSAGELVLYATIGELPSTAAPEAIKAQAVACYTYFCYQRQSRADDDSVSFDVAGTAQPYPEAFCEEYWRAKWGDTYDTVMPLYTAAVDEVLGQRVLYNGAPAMTAYHAINAGRTESAAVAWEGEVPYLQSVASPADLSSPEVISTVTLTAADASAKLTAAVEKLDLSGDYTTWFGESQRSEAGTVVSVPLGGQTVTGAQVRTALGLRSADFEVTAADGNLIFTVHGYGHFVGMSQYGANALAADGYSWQEILAYYYPGTTIG